MNRYVAAIAVGLGMLAILAAGAVAQQQPRAVPAIGVVSGSVIRVDLNGLDRPGDILVRLRGLATPEMTSGQYACEAELAAGLAAAAALESLLEDAGGVVALQSVDFASDPRGWPIATVMVDMGGDGAWTDLAGWMIDLGHGLPDHGGARPDWCALLEQQ